MYRCEIDFYRSVHLFSHVQLFVTPWTAACQAPLSITNSQSLLKLMSIESVMTCNHLILCCPFLLLPSIFPGIRVFSNESVLRQLYVGGTILRDAVHTIHYLVMLRVHP